MEKLNLEELPAYPDNVTDCHKELTALHQLIYNERLKVWKQIEKLTLAHKSAKGEVSTYRKQYLEVRKELADLKSKLSALPFDLSSL